jgi:hypothetical protein
MHAPRQLDLDVCMVFNVSCFVAIQQWPVQRRKEDAELLSFNVCTMNGAANASLLIQEAPLIGAVDLNGTFPIE